MEEVKRKSLQRMILEHQKCTEQADMLSQMYHHEKHPETLMPEVFMPKYIYANFTVV